MKKISWQLLFAIIVLSTNIVYAQDTLKVVSVGLHGGFNTGVLDAGSGLSFSLQAAFRPQKVIQPELAISIDNQSGTSFGGRPYSSSAFTVLGGLRLNLRPRQFWNPSLFFMPGIMMGRYQSRGSNTNDNYSSKGSSVAGYLGLSNSFQQKHIFTTGFLSGDDFSGFLIKYGFLF